MRCALILSMLTASLAHAAWKDYVEVRDLDLDAAGLAALDVVAGAGSLEVTGARGAERIHVTATIEVPDADDDEARRIIESHLELGFERDGDRAVLTSRFERGWRLFGDGPRVNLEIRVPESLALTIDDGSGSIDVSGMNARIDVRDGSGSLRIDGAGSDVTVDDGSGSVDVRRVRGDLRIDDGSGSIEVRDVTGSVTVDDGSGSIRVGDVGGDLIVEDDGSGSLRHSNVSGAVEDRS